MLQRVRFDFGISRACHPAQEPHSTSYLNFDESPKKKQGYVLWSRYPKYLKKQRWIRNIELPKLSSYRFNISRVLLTLGGMHGFPSFWQVWKYLRLFWALRRSLRAALLSDPKFWSTEWCWPFRQHIGGIWNCTAVTEHYSHIGKSDSRSI